MQHVTRFHNKYMTAQDTIQIRPSRGLNFQTNEREDTKVGRGDYTNKVKG
jgi:hypothetical protein